MILTTPDIENLTQDVTDFIMKNDHKHIYKDWARQQIEDEIRYDILHKACLVVRDWKGNIIGVGHGKPSLRAMTFFVTGILCVDKRAFPLLVKLFSILWEGYIITADRKKEGNLKLYNTPKFLRKVLKNA